MCARPNQHARDGSPHGRLLYITQQWQRQQGHAAVHGAAAGARSSSSRSNSSSSGTQLPRTCSTRVPIVICPGWLCCVRQSASTLTTMLVLLMATRAPTNAPCSRGGKLGHWHGMWVIGMGCGSASLQHVCSHRGAARRTAAQHRRKAQPGSQVGESRYQAARQRTCAALVPMTFAPSPARAANMAVCKAKGSGSFVEPARQQRRRQRGGGATPAAAPAFVAGSLYSDSGSTQQGKQAKHPRRDPCAQPKHVPAAGPQTGPRCARPAAW